MTVKAGRRPMPRSGGGDARSAPADALLLRAGRMLLFAHLLLSPLVFSTQTMDAFEHPKVALLTTTSILLAGGALMLSARRWMRGDALVPELRRARLALREPLTAGMALFWFSCAVSALPDISVSPRTSFYGAHESQAGLITMTAYAVLFLGTRALVRDAGACRRLLLAPCLAAAITSLYSFTQLVGLDPIRWGRTAGFGGTARVFGSMGHPNFLSAFLVMAFPLTVYFAVRSLRAGFQALGGAFIFMALLDTAIVGVCLSRGAWAAYAAVLVVLVLGRAVSPRVGRAGAWIVLCGIAASGLLLLAVSTFPEGRAALGSLHLRLLESSDPSSLTRNPRWFIWVAAFRMFKDNPLFGVGLDAFSLAFARYRTVGYWNVEWNATPGKAHNEALHVLATQGLLGALAALALTAGVVVTLRRALQRGRDDLLVVAILASVVGFYAQGLFGFTVAGCGTLFVTLAAALSRLGEPSRPPPGETAPAPARQRTAPHRTGTLSTVVQAAIFLATLSAVWHAVWIPLAASVECRRGGGTEPASSPRSPEDLPHVRRAVQLDPSREVYWVRLATTARSVARRTRDPVTRRGLLIEAREAYQRSLDLVPANSYNWGNLGRLLGDLAKESPPLATREECYAAFERALKLDPNNAYFYVDFAHAALSFGDLARGREEAAHAHQLYPRFGPPQAQMGYALLVEVSALASQGKEAESKPMLEEAALLLREASRDEWYGDEAGQALARSNLAAALIQLGRFQEALSAAQAAVGAAPDNTDIRFNLGRALDRLGRLAEAHGEYVAILRARPDHGMAKQALRALRRRMQAAGVEPPTLSPGLQRELDRLP